MALNYRIEGKLEPDVGKPGSRVLLKVKLSDVIGELKEVRVRVREWPAYQSVLSPVEDYYRMEAEVPYIAPTGTYHVEIYGKDSEGNAGPILTLPFRIGY